MEYSTSNNNRVRTIIALILFLAALSYSGWQYRVNIDLESSLDESRLKSESLLSEKLSLQKNIEQMKAAESEFRENIRSLQKQSTAAESENARKDETNSRILRELASTKKKLSAMEASRNELEQQLAAMTDANRLLQNEKADLNSAMASLQQHNAELKAEADRAHVAFYDRAMVEPLRGKKDKLMSKASRTQRLRATFVLPSNLKELNFKITNPAGEVISNSPEDGLLAVRVADDNQGALTSTGSMTTQTFKQVEVLFEARKNLTAGVYTIEIQSEGLAVGSVRLKLR